MSRPVRRATFYGYRGSGDLGNRAATPESAGGHRVAAWLQLGQAASALGSSWAVPIPWEGWRATADNLDTCRALVDCNHRLGDRGGSRSGRGCRRRWFG